MRNFTKALKTAAAIIMSRPADLRKFYNPTVERGQRVWPKTTADCERYGVRWDYDGIVKLSDGKEYYKFQLQANSGKIPSTIKRWVSKHGTHAVITVMHIEKGKKADPLDFEASMDKALENEGL